MPVFKRLQSRAIVVTFATIFALAIVPTQAAEPLFLGKTLTQWKSQLEDPSETTRLQAAASLAQMGPAAAEVLRVALDHQDSCVRHWAAAGLGRIGAGKELPPADRDRIVAALKVGLQDKEATVRISAAAALARCGHVEAGLSTLAAALQDPIAGARIQAASALADLGDEARPARAAILAAKQDSNDYVVRLATRMLSRLDAKE